MDDGSRALAAEQLGWLVDFADDHLECLVALEALHSGDVCELEPEAQVQIIADALRAARRIRTAAIDLQRVLAQRETA